MGKSRLNIIKNKDQSKENLKWGGLPGRVTPSARTSRQQHAPQPRHVRGRSLDPHKFMRSPRVFIQPSELWNGFRFQRKYICGNMFNQA